MTHQTQRRRRRHSAVCHRHPTSKPTTGFCATCLRERLSTIEALTSPLAASDQVPELRRVRSYSVRDASAADFDQPRRRSCDVRSNDRFADDDDEELLESSIRFPMVPDLKEEEEEEEDGEVIRGFDEGEPSRRLVEEEEIEDGEQKTMKELIDLESRNLQSKKNNSKDIASVFSRTLKKFSLKHPKNKSTLQNPDAGNALGRRSCDVDPRPSHDAGRISFEEPRASWDGCLIGKTYPKLIPLSSVTEDAKASPEKKPKDEEEEEKKPGGTAQTRDYYLDSRRRRSFDRSSRHGLLEVDELKAISNAKVSPETVGLFHGAKLLVTERELRDSNWYSIKNYKPESLELGGKGVGGVAAGEVKQDGFALKKSGKKWSKGWNLWGLIHRKTDNATKNEIKTGESLKLGGNAVDGSLAESLLKLRRVAKGESNGDVSEKLIRSYSVSARKSCDGIVHGAASVVNGFEGGRSSCDGLFHGSVETGRRSSCEDGLFHAVEGNRNRLLQRDDAKLGTYSPDNLRNGMVRFYLTPLKTHTTSNSGKTRLMN
ncbi:unnamed protein product [Microthlaspi erraticum]|uniref:Uncharacterized protein n=1 Tax=Microthlaspi erraticum TaxID=1685480 RepID=A0A6D2IPB7_9BRAS|nr:unnamed protein product [Microthlaspi erraticum]